jgi:diguanylate cyclase (GGDEF)-like protein/PAS domain S-box-containing protein
MQTSDNTEMTGQTDVSGKAKFAETVEPINQDIPNSKQAEKIQAAIYLISQAAYSADKLDDLYYQIHTILGDLMPVENFFIAIYDADEDMLSFPYFVDDFDEKPAPRKLGRGITEYILRTGRPLLGLQHVVSELEKMGEITRIGSPSLDWLGVPLKVKDRTIGVMAAQTYKENVRFGENELNILTFVSTQVAMVIERKRAEEEIIQRQRDLETLLDGLPGFAFFKDKNGVYRMANKKFCDSLGISTESIVGKTDYDIFPQYLADKYSADDRVVIEGGQPFVIGEEEMAEGNLTVKVTTRKVPLKEQNGEVVGLVGLGFDVTEIKQAEQALRETQAQLAQRVQELERRTHEITLLTELVNMLQICSKPSEAYSVISQLGRQLFPELDGELFLMDEARHTLELRSGWGESAMNYILAFHPEDCWGLRRGRPYVVLDTNASLLCKHVGILSEEIDYCCIPVISQGKDIGVLHLRTRPGIEMLTNAHQQLAQAMTEQVGLALANMQLRENMREQALRDPLSGLYNRYFMQASLENELSHARRDSHPVSLIMIDIDHFRELNANFGHPRVDEMLSELGRLLKNSIRAGDIACRYGGDEFLLILPNTQLEVARLRGEQLRSQIKTISIRNPAGKYLNITASLGIATWPDHGDTATDLLMAADGAMFRAKEEGRDRIVVAVKANL